jgi:hypothetical protein
VSDVLPPDDPHGDRAWQAEQRRKRGRRAIFDELEEYVAAPEGKAAAEAATEAAKAAGVPPGAVVVDDDGIKFDRVMMPRLFGKMLRLVPVSLPDPCPITPLGKNGRTYHYLTPKGELVELTDAEHGQAHIASVWAPEIDALNAAFPQLDQHHKFTGFRANYARDAMMKACAVKPIFQAHDKVRGLGCWLGDAGELIQHLGDRVLVGAETRKLGEIEGYVYPGRATMVAGVDDGGRDKCREIYRHLRGWYWARGDLDARLLLGQLGSTVLGAALDWRPMAFLCGDASTGKSTLQRWMRQLLPQRLKGTADASEASLRALLGQDAVGVSFDEIEADAANDKAQQVMSLARKAASGDDVYRSSQNQQLKQFTLRGSFIFSAIIPPSMRPADMQRFAFLLLKTLPKDARLSLPDLAATRALGVALVGRITQGWPRWQETLDAFQLGLGRVGHAQRSALQFGTLLAAAHVLTEDGAPTPAEVDRWCDPLKRETLFEYQGAEPVWLKAFRHVINAQPDIWRNEGSPTVADIVRRWLRETEKDGRDKLHAKLNGVGLAMVQERETGRVFLAIPPRHPGLRALFRGTDFQAAGGGEGAWHIPLTGAPKVEGDVTERRGVYRSDKVPRLDRQRCDMFWLDGRVEIAGVWTSIFDRTVEDDFVDPEQMREPGEEG